MFDWLSYLEVARRLVDGDQQLGEACRRSAISRAYYGVFGKGREVLQQQGLLFEREAIHAQVIRTLRREPPTSELGRDLDRLRRERNEADYNAEAKFPYARADQALNVAQRIVEQMRLRHLL